ncbi:MAG TPA: GFA family protein [Burkholderiales bacterium]|nr:GFA family protein [Burkholderiales bacterium]
MSSALLAGSCLCGSVRFEVKPPFSAFRYCHCSRCQKASGSAHAANAFVSAAQFSWRAGDAQIKRYDHPAAQRFSVWFCENCGSRVPHPVRGRDDYLIPAGLLDQPPADMARPQNSIFWGSRAPWYVPPQEMPCLNEYT